MLLTYGLLDVLRLVKEMVPTIFTHLLPQETVSFLFFSSVGSPCRLDGGNEVRFLEFAPSLTPTNNSTWGIASIKT